MGLEQMETIVMSKLETWWLFAVKMIPNLVTAGVVLFLFWYLAKFSRNIAQRVLSRTVKHAALRSLIGTCAYLLVFFVGVFIALEILKLDKAVTSLLAGVGIIGLALGFAFQEIASNFVSGVLIALQRPYSVGDVIEVSGFIGTVTEIQLRVTVVRTADGLEILIPNKTLFTSPVKNFTLTPDRRIDIEVGVSYGDDLEKVKVIAREALESVPGRTEKEVQVFFKDFADSSINLVAQVWIVYPGNNNYWIARDAMITQLKAAFDKNDISIPFPIRTMDFGIKGGVELSEVLSQDTEEKK